MLLGMDYSILCDKHTKNWQQILVVYLQAHSDLLILSGYGLPILLCVASEIAVTFAPVSSLNCACLLFLSLWFHSIVLTSLM